MPLQDEERLFIEAIRDLNFQASKLQEEENQVILNAIDNDYEEKTFENENNPPLSPLSRLAALAAASEIENRTSVTLDIAATAAMDAAQKANHYSATYNLEKAMAWIPTLKSPIYEINDNKKHPIVSDNVIISTPVSVEGDDNEVIVTEGSKSTPVCVEDDEDEVPEKVGSKRILKKTLPEQLNKRSCRVSKNE